MHNQWINGDVEIEKEISSSLSERYSASFVFDGAYYRIVGGIEEKEFMEIVKRLIPWT